MLGWEKGEEATAIDPRQGLILVMNPTETVKRDDTMWCNSKEYEAIKDIIFLLCKYLHT